MPREKLKQTEAHGRNDKVPANRQQICLFDPVILFGAEIIADNGLNTLRNTHDDRKQDGIGFHDNPAGSQGDLLTIDRKGPVVRQRVVQHDLNNRNGDLVQAAARPHVESSECIPHLNFEAVFCQRNGPKVPQVAKCQQKGEDLSQNRGQCRSKNAPLKREDENGVQNGVGDGSGHHAYHGIFGAAIGPNQIADAVCQDQKRHPQQRDSRILSGKRHHFIRGPKHP